MSVGTRRHAALPPNPEGHAQNVRDLKAYAELATDCGAGRIMALLEAAWLLMRESEVPEPERAMMMTAFLEVAGKPPTMIASED